MMDWTSAEGLAKKALAESIVKSYAAKWQVLNRSEWRYQFRGKALVRYIDLARIREEEAVALLDYLSDDVCKETLSLMDQGVAEGWCPIRAWFEASNKAAGSVAGIRLYHALQTDPDENVDGPYVVDDGCAYKVSIEYHWSETEPPTAPASSSGVVKKISGLQRDPESGRYSYAIETHERVQQDIEKYLTSSTVFSDTYVEQHIGVKEDDVDSTGEAASADGGRIVSRQISKNADCTKDVSNRTVVEKRSSGSSESVRVGLTGTVKTTQNRNMPEKASSDELGVGESVENNKTDGGLWNQTIRRVVRSAKTWLGRSCRKTIFGESHTEHQVVGSDPGFDHVVEASGGVIEEKRVSVTSDGAYDVSSHKTIEKPVKEASESVSVTLTGKSVVTHHRNMADKAGSDGLDVGESVENTRTEGGLWNQTIRKRVIGALLKIAESCRKTISSHSHSSSVVRSDDPGFTHVSSAGGGVVHQESVSRTSDGSYRVESRDDEEIPVSDATVRIVKGLHGVQRTVKDIHQSTVPPEPTKTGDSVEYSITPGGLRDVTKTTRSGSGGVLGAEGSETFYTKSTGETKNVEEDEAAVPDVSFENGKVVRKSVSRNGDGTSNEHTTTTTAKPYLQKYDWVSGDTHHWVVRYRNQDKEFAGTVTPTDASVSKEDSVNDFGLHDGVVRWSKGPWTTTVGDLKFVKHGVQIHNFICRRNRRTRRLEHQEVTYQVVHIRGDAYTDYVSQEMEANPRRTDTGVIAIKLIRGPYKDKDGNLLAEWKKLVAGKGYSDTGWTPCMPSCKHWKETGDDNPYQRAIDELVNSSEYSDASQKEVWQAVVSKLETLFKG